jgi:TonB family protein
MSDRCQKRRGIPPTAGMMSRGRARRAEGRRWQILPGIIVGLFAMGCKPAELALPPVKTPLGILVCEPPKPATIPVAPPPGSSCGLASLGCDERRPLVIRVDERGQVKEAYIPGMRSPALDECVLAEVRALGWAFEPAHECNGDPLPGEYTHDFSIECGKGRSEGQAPPSVRPAAASTPTGSEPFHLGPGITSPELIAKGQLSPYLPDPISHPEGSVIVEATIDCQGVVKHVTVVRSLGPAFDTTVVEYVRTSRYAPARKGGSPVAVILPVTVTFTLAR